MEPVVICSVSDILDASIGQQDVVLSLRNSVVVLILRVAKVVSSVEIADSITKGVARLLFLGLVLLFRMVVVGVE